LTLVLADDHPIVLDGLAQLFQLEPDVTVRARCRSGEETLRALRIYRPDVVVLDVRMPGGDGLWVLRAIRSEQLPSRAVLLTAALDPSQFTEALRLGARGIVLKEMAPQLLVAAVREVHAGGEWIESSVVDRIRSSRGSGANVGEPAEERASLTPRELEIVGLVAIGLRNRAIAERLCISEGTVKIHLHNVYEKLRVSGRLELVLYAQTRGLV
jgi:DNA-binding NarL/FixJ family response regulator